MTKIRYCLKNGRKVYYEVAPSEFKCNVVNVRIYDNCRKAQKRVVNIASNIEVEFLEDRPRTYITVGVNTTPFNYLTPDYVGKLTVEATSIEHIVDFNCDDEVRMSKELLRVL